MKKIVLATLGSHGDLHPYLALGLELKARGHQVTVATTPYYREKIEALGLGFHGVRPPITPGDRRIVEAAMDLKSGSEFIVRQVVFPHVRESYEDTLAVCKGADLLVTQMLAFSGPLIAEQTGIRWASTVLAPLSFFSAHEVPIHAGYPWLALLRYLGPSVQKGLAALARGISRPWAAPLDELRAELGLAPKRANPIFEGQHSDELVLAMFSRLIGEPQPDWPRGTKITGFVFFDDPAAQLSPELRRFLDEGEPPVVFTLGTAAVHTAGEFYAESAAAARLLKRRAVLLIGKEAGNDEAAARLAGRDIFVTDYASYKPLFERASAIVHQGGIGTTAEALRSGRPSLIVPFGHDQPDNAARACALGVARSVPRAQYRASMAAAHLRELLENVRVTSAAREIGERIRSENGLKNACDALEQLLSEPARSRHSESR